ncbi:MAG: DNA translocase FtsK [Mycoplasmatales bacterium]|nr:DNA translocase FtsK [Mycoplasmatales bacterium]
MNNLNNNPQNQYSPLRDRKILGMILLIVAVSLQIFAFLEVPFLSSIHAYTVGMLFGVFNPFFYLFVCFRGIKMILPSKWKLPKWFKLTTFNYWFIVLSIIFTVHAWGVFPKEHFKEKDNLNTFGVNAWERAIKQDWWESFKEVDKNNMYWKPNSTWGGLVGYSIWAFFAMFSSPIGAGVIAAVLLIFSVSFLITGSMFGLYKFKKNKKRQILKEKEAQGAELIEVKEEQEPITQTEHLINTSEFDLPFEDPFAEEEDVEQVTNTQIQEQVVQTEAAVSKPKRKIPYIHPEYPIIKSEEVLNTPKDSDTSQLKEEITEKAKKLQELFITFKIDAKVSRTVVGPTLTKYIITPGPGINLKKFAQLEQNIKMVLAATDVRMELPIPGEAAIGVEVPNANPQMVAFKDIFDEMNESEEYKKEPLAVALGKTINGQTLVIPINKTPHLLVAGATGSGKSVGINAILMSMIMRTSPEHLRLVLVDPKMVEFMPYNKVPHLLTPVITDPEIASKALDGLVDEMERRYSTMAGMFVRNIEEYNAKAKEKWPYIVCVIDELADLMNVAAKIVETSIQRITQKARAAGIHLIVATQRPSTNVVTGVIKANIPSRISFSVTSGVDSKVILDSVGAEKLMGRGDMLMSLYGKGIERAQGAYLSNEEIEAIIDKVKDYPAPPSFDILGTNNDEDEELEFDEDIVRKQEQKQSEVDFMEGIFK